MPHLFSFIYVWRSHYWLDLCLWMFIEFELEIMFYWQSKSIIFLTICWVFSIGT